MNKINLIIPIYNRIETTKQGLQSIHTSLDHYKRHGKGTISWQVVIVDDGSTDGSGEWINEHYKTVKVLRGNGNLWWSGGINMGIEYSLSQDGLTHIILWNDDTTCNPGYFTNLEAHLQNPEYSRAILASKILWEDKEDTLFNFGCTFDWKTGESKLIGFNQKDGVAFSKPRAIDWSGGMGTIIPISIIKVVGLFDDVNFPQYHGDKDYWLRAVKKGFKAYALPDLLIWNNRATTGVRLAKPYTRSFINCLTSKRSHLNIFENYTFVKKHSPGFRGLLFFTGSYSRFFLTYVKKSLRLDLVKNALTGKNPLR